MCGLLPTRATHACSKAKDNRIRRLVSHLPLYEDKTGIWMSREGF